MYSSEKYRVFGYVSCNLRELSLLFSLCHMPLSSFRLFHVQLFGSVACCWSSNSSHILTRSVFLATTSANRLRITRTMTTEKKPFERLPTNVTPKNYQLTLQPNLTEFTFTGKEVVDVEVRAHFTLKFIEQGFLG